MHRSFLQVLKHIQEHTYRTFTVSIPDVSPPLSALQRRPAGSVRGSSPAWSTGRNRRCLSTASPPLRCDLRSDPTDTPACLDPDCSNGTRRQTPQLLAYSKTWLLNIEMLREVKASPPDEGLCSLQCADPGDGATGVAVQDLLSPPGVQVPDMNGTLPRPTKPKKTPHKTALQQ